VAFKELDDFLEVKPVELPIHGKLYSFPGEITGEAWLFVQSVGERYQRAQKALAAGEDPGIEDEVLTDIDEQRLRREMLGDTQAEMIADGLSSAAMKLVLVTLIAYHLSGREAAEAVWNNQGEAPAPNRATRRAKAPAKSARSRGSHDG